MKDQAKYEFSDRKLRIIVALSGMMLGLLCFKGSAADSGTSAPAELSQAAQEVVSLARAHMSDDIIMAYIRNSKAIFNLSANDILYLNSQGVSQPVISAMIQAQAAVAPPSAAPLANSPTPPPANPVPASAPQVLPPGEVPPAQPATLPTAGSAVPPPGSMETPPPGSEISLDYFQSQLSPYGQWVYVPGYGQCWAPSIQSQVPGWRPYLNGGHWEYTENGWYWASDYPWGEYVFHYGRWTRVTPYGWVWVPGYEWGPAWVCWRDAEAAGYCAWAPLPPGTRFEPGVGIIWNGQVAGDVDFGLAPDMFVFVPFDHFWAHDYVPWVAPSFRVPGLFHASWVINGYGFVGGRFVLGGLGHDRIVLRTHFDAPLFHIGFHDARIARDHAWGFGFGHDRGGWGFRDHHRR